MSNESDNVPLHPVVRRAIEQMQEQPDGMLAQERLDEWQKVLHTHKERQDIGVQFIALAMRAYKDKLEPLMEQFVILAAFTLGQEQAKAQLEAAGLVSKEAAEMLEKTKTRTDSLAKGLEKSSAKRPGRVEPEFDIFAYRKKGGDSESES